jgi:hypothetical protein
MTDLDKLTPKEIALDFLDNRHFLSPDVLLAQSYLNIEQKLSAAMVVIEAAREYFDYANDYFDARENQQGGFEKWERLEKLLRAFDEGGRDE